MTHQPAKITDITQQHVDI